MNDPSDQPKLKKSRIDFVLIQLPDDAAVERNVGAVCGIAERFGADFDLFGSLITLTWGTLVDEEPRDKRPEKLIAEVSDSLGKAAKILYGSEIGHSGFLVGTKHVRYNVMLPHFTEARHRIGNLEWGQVLKFRR